MVQRLVGHLSVDESAKRIRHYRYAEERMMRVMGGWIALTPELGAKLLFGRHVWDCAQHADLWGKRLPELRAPAQVSEPPNDAFVGFMDLLESAEAFGQTLERLVGIYGVLKPHLVATYEHHLTRANPVYEPPTRRILQRAIEDERRHIAAGRLIVAHHLKDEGARGRAAAWQEKLAALLVEAGGMAGDGLSRLAPSEIPADLGGVAGDLVELEKPTGRWPLSPELAAALQAHALNLERGNLGAVAEDLAPEFRAAGEDLYRSVAAGGVERHAVVGVARLGSHRQIKLRLETSQGAVLLLSRWARQEGHWRVVEAEVVRTEPA